MKRLQSYRSPLEEVSGDSEPSSKTNVKKPKITIEDEMVKSMENEGTEKDKEEKTKKTKKKKK